MHGLKLHGPRQCTILNWVQKNLRSTFFDVFLFRYTNFWDERIFFRSTNFPPSFFSYTLVEWRLKFEVGNWYFITLFINISIAHQKRKKVISKYIHLNYWWRQSVLHYHCSDCAKLTFICWKLKYSNKH